MATEHRRQGSSHRRWSARTAAGRRSTPTGTAYAPSALPAAPPDAPHCESRRDGVPCSRPWRDHRLGLGTIGGASPREPRSPDQVMNVCRFDARPRGDREGEQHAGDGGMHAGHEHAVPQQAAHQHVRRQGVHVRPVHGSTSTTSTTAAAMASHMQRGALAVEDGDDQNGDDVVGHGQAWRGTRARRRARGCRAAP